MDLTDRLIAHDLWLIDDLLQRADALTDAELDQPLDAGQTNVEELGVTTLRELLDHLVFTKETWTASIAGRTFDDAGRQTTISAMRGRLAQVGPEFQTIVRGVRERGDWDNAFIDAQCDPPETFTYAGAIAHVITFSAHRRELAIGAMRSLGIQDLGYGDPIEWERQRSVG